MKPPVKPFTRRYRWVPGVAMADQKIDAKQSHCRIIVQGGKTIDKRRFGQILKEWRERELQTPTG